MSQCFTSPNYWGCKFQQIFEGDGNKIPKKGYLPTPGICRKRRSKDWEPKINRSKGNGNWKTYQTMMILLWAKRDGYQGRKNSMSHPWFQGFNLWPLLHVCLNLKWKHLVQQCNFYVVVFNPSVSISIHTHVKCQVARTSLRSFKIKMSVSM